MAESPDRPWTTPDPLNLSAPESTAALAEVGAERVVAAADAPRTPLKAGYITLLVFGVATLYVAFIAPISFSLAVRVGQLDPDGRNSGLALAIGIPSFLALIASPIAGVLSDRTRSRIGRRRPWLLGGTIVGVIGSLLVGLAPSVPLLIVFWSVTYIAYSIAGAQFLYHLGDRLPEEQRGRVAGVSGAVTQVGPVIGVVLAGMFSTAPVAMFVVPAVIAFVGCSVFVLAMREETVNADVQPFTARSLLSGFWFNPRVHRNLGWVWISRAFIFLALSFMSLYTVYLLGQRLQLDNAVISRLVATAGGLGVLFSIVGAVLSGWLSDRIQRRKPFLLGAAILVAVGLLVTASLTTVTMYYVGALIAVFGVGVYGAVDQAIALDVLPTEEGQNGRYLAVFNLANQLPQAIGPFLAAAVLAASGNQYVVVYVIAAGIALVGGLLILPVRIERKAPMSTLPTVGSPTSAL